MSLLLLNLPPHLQLTITQKMHINELIRSRKASKEMDNFVEYCRYSQRQKSQYILKIHFLDAKKENNTLRNVYIAVSKFASSEPPTIITDPLNQLSGINFKKIEIYYMPIWKPTAKIQLNSFLNQMKFQCELFDFRGRSGDADLDDIRPFLSKIKVTNFCGLSASETISLKEFLRFKQKYTIALSWKIDQIPANLYEASIQLQKLRIQCRSFLNFTPNIERFISKILSNGPENLRKFKCSAPKIDFWTEEMRKKSHFIQLYKGERCYEYNILPGGDEGYSIYNKNCETEINCIQLENDQILVLIAAETKIEFLFQEIKGKFFKMIVLENREELLLSIVSTLFGTRSPVDLSLFVEKGLLDVDWQGAASLLQSLVNSYASFSNSIL